MSIQHAELDELVSRTLADRIRAHWGLADDALVLCGTP
jgi:hypothetical protein